MTDPSFRPDMIELNVPYTITINPDNNHQYTKPQHLRPDRTYLPSDRMYYTTRYIHNAHMLKLKRYATWTLYPEFSTPKPDNKKGVTRLHFHGIIQFYDYEGIKLFYCTWLNKLKDTCMVEIDTIDNIQTFKNYCTKNTTTMKALFKLDNLPYPITSNTPHITNNRVITN